MVLATAGLPHLLDTTLLLTTELCSNGIVHAGTDLDVDIEADQDGVTVIVTDYLAIDLPTPSGGYRDARELDFYQAMARRIDELPGVEGVALGNFVPWRDAGRMGPGFQLTAEGYAPAAGEELPHGRIRMVTADFFSVLGVPLLAGRHFTAGDRADSEPVVIVSESVARRFFANREAVNRRLAWATPGPSFCKPQPCRRSADRASGASERHPARATGSPSCAARPTWRR